MLRPFPILLSVTLAAGLAAQEPPPLPDPAEIEEGPVRLIEETAVGPTPGAPVISLEAAITRALEANFGLLGSADALQGAKIRESATKSQWYPRFTPSYLVNPDDTSILGSATQRLPWTGGSVSALVTLRNSELTVPELSHTGDMRLVLTQPILKGFGPNAAYFDLRNSQRGREGQERQFELVRQRLAVQVTAAFYSVIAQRQLVGVSRQSLKRSENLKIASEARLKVGLVSKLDVFRADLQAAQTQESLVRTEAALQSSLEQFRGLLGLSPGDPVEPEAATLPEVVEHDVIEPLEVLLMRAREQRLDVHEAADQVDDARRSASLAKQNLLPQLDVNLGYVRSGFGPSYNRALEDAQGRFEVYFNTTYPVDNAAAKASKAVADLDLVARERSVRQKHMDVEGEVRAAARELERIQKSVELQKKGVEVAAQQLRLSTLRYQRGLASNFDVVDAEGSLVLARSALVGLLTSYQIARAELLRVTGDLDAQRPVAARGFSLRESTP
ncbi:MAG TPA: TolC family protein [Vicinamibacteria bacterium]